jgi:hypothetical protein
MYKLLILLCLYSVQHASAQTFCLNLSPRTIGNEVDVKLTLVASGAPFKLGTSNLQFRYKGSVLNTPTLQTEKLSSTGRYNGISVTKPTPRQLLNAGEELASFNLNFTGTTEQGLTINTGAGTEIGVIRFHITDIATAPKLKPYYNGAAGSIVYNDHIKKPVFLASNNTCPNFEGLLPVGTVDEQPFSVYPTLAHHQIWLEASSYERQMFQIIDILGHTVLSGIVAQSSQSIDIQNLTVGTYTLKVANKQVKFVKE